MTDPSELSKQQLLAILNGGSSQPSVQPSHPQSGGSATSSEKADLLARLNISPIEDWGRSAVSGIEHGLSSIVGAHGDLSQFAGWSVSQIAQHLGVDPNTAAAIANQVRSGLGQALNRSPLAPAMAGAGAAMTAKPGDLRDAAARGMQAASRMVTGDPYKSADINAAHPEAQYRPNTRTGRYIQTAGEMAPAALFPGNTAQTAARVAVPAVVGQTASELAPEKYKGVAKVGGALVGGGLEGLGEHLLEAPYQTIARVAPNLSDEQVQQAVALREAASRRGVDLTIPEAVQQVTNGATGLGRVQRLVESSNRTAPGMAEYFAKRPDQVRGAVEGFATGISPDMPPPGVLAMNAQRAGQGGLDFVRKSINEAAQPYYDALPGQQIPTDQLTFADRPDATAALADALGDVRGNKVLNAKIAGLPDNDLAVLNEVAKRLGRNSDAYAQTAMNPGGDNAISAANSAAKQKLDALAEAVSGDWRGARGTVAYGRSQFLDPLQAGPVGKIAATDELSAQTGALYPRNPPVGAPAETAQAVDVLNTQDPSVPAALTRQHLQNTFNQSTRALSTGPNQYGGARYMADLLGNSEQEATLRAGLDRIDQSGKATSDLDQLADILQATGRRERPGSMTAFNAEDQKALNIAPATVRFLGGLGDPLEWTKTLSNWTGGALGRRKLDVLADLLTDPDTAAVLARARAARPQAGVARLAAPALAAENAQ